MGFLKKLKKAVKKVVKIAAPVAAGFIPGGNIALSAVQTISSARGARKAARREAAQYERAQRAALVPEMVEYRHASRSRARKLRFGGDAPRRSARNRRARKVQRRGRYLGNLRRAS